MDFLELIRIIIMAMIQGVTEWLPVSSTGHMILVQQFFEFSHSEAFWSVFIVVIQLASVMAVVIAFFKQLNPVSFKGGFGLEIDKINLWLKIVIACLPAAIVGVLFDDLIEAHLNSPLIIALMLIFYGLLFILVENRNDIRIDHIDTLGQISYKLALLIGIFQMLAIIPGTSRSGATIIGGLMLGMSRKTAAEFTFFLAIPVMFGASMLRIMRLGMDFTNAEWLTLIIGCAVAFIVSLITIKFLLGFIKQNSFKPFAYYRIALGLLVLVYFYLII